MTKTPWQDYLIKRRREVYPRGDCTLEDVKEAYDAGYKEGYDAGAPKWVEFRRDDPNLPTDWGYYLVRIRKEHSYWKDVSVSRTERSQEYVTDVHYEINLCNSLGDFEDEHITHYQIVDPVIAAPKVEER